MSGQSFTSFVLEQRLLAAYRLLREPKSRWRKVSDIAAATGFSDISYFNRVFRNRFSATPTEVRVSPQAGLPGAADPAVAADEEDAASEQAGSIRPR
jgi:AraC-like DNA-binding protein